MIDPTEDGASGAPRKKSRTRVMRNMKLRSPGWREIRQVADPAVGGGDTDHELVLVFQRDPASEAGRQAASRLLARYRRRVLTWCWRVVGDREAALDLAQEVLLSAFDRLPEYDHYGRFGAWLFTIARHRCLSELRRRRVPLAEDAVLELVADPAPGPDEALERRLAADELFDLVRSALTAEEQTALWLRCHEGLPVDVITRRLSVDQATGARGLLQRARRKLRAALELRDGEEHGGGG
jgi:RNA polymerase sigma-70 factor (ECF subfamily)